MSRNYVEIGRKEPDRRNELLAKLQLLITLWEQVRPVGVYNILMIISLKIFYTLHHF